MSGAANIGVGLLSHTNAGKTTLARTLLRKDIGEIGDRAHVTEDAERHLLIASGRGDTLSLWDTPGFGDSMRLYSRLNKSENPMGWALSQVWDRFTDRPFWSGQQAMRSAREQCDVVLYVINAAELPEEARYIDVEMRILEWIGKPVVLVLNQLGPPRTQAQTSADMALWRTHLAAHSCIRGVLSLDAFARCWVQEDTLLAQITAVVAPELRDAGERLGAAWHARNYDVFQASMRVLAKQLAKVAVDEEQIAEADVQKRIRGWVNSVATGADRADPDLERAERALRSRFDDGIREGLDELISLHGLSGQAATDKLQALAHALSVERPADENKASILGGLLSGAAGGLAADLAAGGLTFGAGALIGGVLGAVGARSITQIYNIARGREAGRVRWSSEFLAQRVAAALLSYLAVAHFGRGRGEFVHAAVPEHWQQAISSNTKYREALDATWELAKAGDLHRTEQKLTAALTGLAREILIALYPDAAKAVEPAKP
jgi:hypothetical protein